MRIRPLLVVLLALSGPFISEVVAQQVPPSPSPAIATASPLTERPNDQDERLVRLEQTVGVIREYNDDFMSVVVWSLTTVAGLVVLLLGFNLFQSQRAVRREFESLRAELRSLVDSRIAQAESPLRERVDGSLTQLERKLKAVAAEATSPVSQKAEDIDSRVLRLEWKALEAEYGRWLKGGILANACTSAARMLAIASKPGWGTDYYLTTALDNLLEVIRQVEAKGQKLDADTVNEVENTLSRLGSDHAASRTAILQRIVRLQSS